MRLLDALTGRTASNQGIESRYGLDDLATMLYNGQQYIVGPSGSKPDEVDSNFVHRIQRIHNRHGVIAAAVATRSMLISQVRFQWRRPDGSLYGNRDLLPLERPGSTTRPELLSRLEVDASYSGTGVVGRRGGELFRLSPDRTKFVLGSDSDPEWDGDVLVPPFDTKVVGVIYDAGSSHSSRTVGQVEAFGPGEFAVWAPEPDPLYFWKGTSWVTSVVREMLIDGQVTDHESKFFEKAATPGLVFMMDPSRTPDEIKAYQDVVDRKFAGTANSYKNMFLGGATDVKVVGSAMTDLGLSDLQGTFENRVAVRSRIPAVVLGTKESLSGSSLNAGNYSAARRMLADGWFSPTVDNLCAALEAVVPPPGDGSELGHDPSRVLFLQEDQKDAADITQTQAVAMRQLVEAGFDPLTVVDAVKTGDMSKLAHTGNVSVQLQPPGSGNNDADRSTRSSDLWEQLPLFNVHNHLPESRDVVVPAPLVQMDAPVVNVAERETHVHVDAPVVNVDVPEQRMGDIIVNPTPVNVNVEPTPVTVDNTVSVEPTPVTVENRVDVPLTKHKVRRNTAGDIVEVIEEPVEE